MPKDNIMLSHPYSAGGIVKIVDFGLAAVIPWGENGPDANMYYNMFSQVRCDSFLYHDLSNTRELPSSLYVSLMPTRDEGPTITCSVEFRVPTEFTQEIC